MASLLDRFKKRKHPERDSARARASTEPIAAEVKSTGGRERRILGFVFIPHLTEKSSMANARGWYTFRIPRKATKILVKQAVEDRYGVSVERVRMIAHRPKAIRLGRIEGRVPGFKKAMVKVKAGQKIEVH